MPRIPVGEFGGMVAGPAPLERVQEKGAMAVAKSLGGLGASLEGAAATGYQQITNEQLASNREAEIAKRKLEMAQEKADAAAERRERMLASGRARVAMSGFEADSMMLAGDITSRVKAGTLKSEDAQAELSKGLDQARNKVAGQFNEEHQPDLQSAYIMAGARSTLHLNGLMEVQAHEQRVADLDTTAENLQRQGESDPRGAMDKITRLYGAEGSQVLGPDKAGAKAQTLREHVAFNYVAAQVEAAATSPKQLKSVDLAAWPELTPESKNALTARINDHLARGAAKAEAYQAKRENAAKRAIDDARDAITSGADLTPQRLNDAVVAARGTPFEAGAKALPQMAASVAGFANAPAATQDATINQLSASLKANWSREGVERLGQLTQLRNNVQTQAEKDPIGLGEKQGKVPVMLLNPLAPDFAANLQQRVQWGDTMAKQYGVEPQYLKPEEGKAIAGFLADKTPEERASVLKVIAGATGDPTINRAVMKTIYKDDPAAAIAGDFMAQQTATPEKTHWFKANEPSRSVGELILKGQGRIDGKEVKTPPQKDMEAQFASVVGSALDHNPAARKEAFDTAYRIYQGTSPSFDGQLNGAAYTQAVQWAIGGKAVASPGGDDVLPPYGMDEGHFRDAAAAHLQSLGLPANSNLLNIGDGYAVKHGAGLVGDPKTGKPLVFRIKPGEKLPVKAPAKGGAETPWS